MDSLLIITHKNQHTLHPTCRTKTRTAKNTAQRCHTGAAAQPSHFNVTLAATSAPSMVQCTFTTHGKFLVDTFKTSKGLICSVAAAPADANNTVPVARMNLKQTQKEPRVWLKHTTDASNTR
jgi:hypothetical protein